MRLIDADKLIEAIKEKCIDNYDGECSECEECPLKWIESTPIIETEPVKHGHWIIKDNIYPMYSECGELSDFECDGTYKQSLFCPNCGAKMEEEK